MIAPLFALPLLSAALQSTPLAGVVRDSATHAPIASVVVLDVASRRQTTTDPLGRFSLEATPPLRLRFQRAGYATRELAVTSAVAIEIELAPSARGLEAVTVTALRGGPAYDAAPISQRVIGRDEIDRRYFGQDVPIVLQSATSLTSYAETANYWGYSYIRLRGIDQSRINLTVDGIPLNDPEDQVLYFADFPDLTSSLESVQIQRGVGTSSAGTASYAGAINLETTPLAVTGSRTNVEIQAGSFASRRLNAEYQSGLLPSGFAIAGRVSALESDGYRYHSGVLGRSAFLSAGYFGARDMVKLTATAGLLHDTLSYLAVPDTELARDRRVNPLQPTELDRFGEQLASLAYTRLLSASSSLSTTVYRISSSGNYDVAIDPDLWNFHLDFVWYGVTSAWSWQGEGMRASVGVNANTYSRDHFAYTRPDLTDNVYFNTGHKGDASAFAKLAYDVGRATLFGDLQVRNARFRYSPDRNADIAGGSVSWSFVNPKVGISFQAAPALQLYASYGRNSREPARNDMFAGFDNLDTSNAAFVGSFSRVQAETVHDLETGFTLRTGGLRLQGNLFSMDFRNEIAPIGELSYLGLPLRKNVHASWRRGVELDGTYAMTPRLSATATATLMNARIDEYTDDASGVTYHGVESLLTPKIVTSQRVDYAATDALALGVEMRYTGRSQLDNTGDPALVLPPSCVADASATWKMGRSALVVRVNNLGDSKKFGSGYGSGEIPSYYVLPPRNLFVTLKLGL